MILIFVFVHTILGNACSEFGADVSSAVRNTRLVPFEQSRYISPDEFENAALCLRLGPPFKLIRHENGALRKRSSKGRNLEAPPFRFHLGGK